MDKHTLIEVFHQCDELMKYVQLHPIKVHPSKNDFIIAEKELGCSFPPTFVDYWINAKWYIPQMICCVTPSRLGLFDSFDIVKVNREIREESKGNFPPFLLVFDVSAALDDDYHCFDTRFISSDGEYPIAYWSVAEPDYLVEIDTETGRTLEIDDITHTAPDFPSYIYEILKEDIRSCIKREEKKEKEEKKKNQYLPRHLHNMRKLWDKKT